MTPIVLLSTLVACSESIGSVEPPSLASPRSELLKECAQPVLLPDKSLSQFEVEKFWIRDRINLIECAKYKTLLQDFYADRDAKIQGNKIE